MKILFRGQEIEAKRAPTFGDLDLALVERNIGALAAYQQRILKAEADGAPGCADDIARFCIVCNDAAKTIRERVTAAALSIGAVESVANGDEAAATEACIEFYWALRDALGVGALGLGKS